MPPVPPIRIRSVSDYRKDPANANKGTPRGQQAITESFRHSGAGRSVLVDKDDTLIAGNHAADGAAAAGITEVIEVEARPDQLVVVKRSDLDLDSDDADVREKTRFLALADNRTSELGLEWDAAQLQADLAAGLSLDGLFRDDELADLFAAADAEVAVGAAVAKGVSGARLSGDRKKQIKPVLYVDEIDVFERALRATGLDNRGHAVLEICRFYLAEKGEDNA